MQRAVASQRSAIRVPAHILQRQRTLARAATVLEAELGREPTAPELAHATGLPVQHVDAALVAPAAPVSLSLEIGSGDELGDLLADDNAADPADEARASLAAADVRAALHRLPERERRVVELRFGFAGEERTREAIADELALTRDGVSRLMTRALRKMEHALAA
jgi:RNA polymerase primary sigma factor